MSGGEKRQNMSELNVEHKENIWEMTREMPFNQTFIDALATQSPPKKAKTAKRGEITAEKVKEDWAISPILCPSTDVAPN